MLSSLTLHAAPECTIWALAGAVNQHTHTCRHRHRYEVTQTHTDTNTEKEKTQCIFSNFTAARKRSFSCGYMSNTRCSIDDSDISHCSWICMSSLLHNSSGVMCFSFPISDKRYRYLLENWNFGHHLKFKMWIFDFGKVILCGTELTVREQKA